jgi:transposase
MITDSLNDRERDNQADGQKYESGPSHALTSRNFSRRARFSAAKRAQIIAESFEDGANSSAVARRHGIKASLLYLWRKQEKQQKALLNAPFFVPVSRDKGSALSVKTLSSSSVSSVGAIEIESSGAVVRVLPGVDAKTLKIVLDALRA